MSSKPIIITAPHLCFNIVGILANKKTVVRDPACDSSVRSISTQLHKLIGSTFSGTNGSTPSFTRGSSTLVKSKTTRTFCDNNREICRQTPMRQRLRKLMTKNKNNFLLLDIHSFSNGVDFGLLKTPEIVLLDTYKSTETMSLLQTLLKSSILATGIYGSQKNDIQLEAREFGGEAVLIEFWRGLSKKRITEILEVITKWSKTEAKT